MYYHLQPLFRHPLFPMQYWQGKVSFRYRLQKNYHFRYMQSKFGR